MAVRAQSNFRPGYIVSLAGDTVRGTVDASASSRSGSECRFRPVGANTHDKYTPGQLGGYGLTHDRFYESVVVPGAPAPADTAAQPVFLEVLVRGAASLYFFPEENLASHYFLRLGSGPVQPLVLRTDYVVENGTKFKREDALYKGTLAEALRACPATKAGIAKATLTTTSLSRLVRQYNDCVGGGQVVSEAAAARRRNYFLFEAVAGAQTSSLQFQGAYAEGITLRGNTAPVLGLAAQQYTPARNNRLALRLELLYQPQRYQREVFVPTAQPYETYQEVRVRLDQLRVPVMLRYMPLNGRFQPFAEVGVSAGFAITNENEYRYKAIPAAPYSTWRTFLPLPRGIEEALQAGLGASLALPAGHHATAELRAERTNGFSDAVGVATYITRFYFLLSYDITRQR